MTDINGTYTYNPNQQAMAGKAPNPNNGTVPGGINTMIQALMAGNDQYKKQQMQQAAQGSQPLAQASGASPGQPLSLTSPQGDTTNPTNPTQTSAAMGTSPDSMTGGMGMTGTMGGAPMISGMTPDDLAFTQGASPTSVDPVTQALFSSIPGVING